MKTKEEFKIFVNQNPGFATSVKKGKISWQNLYELFVLYEPDSKVFDEYKKEEVVSSASSLSLSSILNTVKGINLDSFQSNLTNIQKAVLFLEEFTRKDTKKENKTKKVKEEPENIERFYTD